MKEDVYRTLMSRIKRSPSLSAVQIVAEVNELHNTSIFPDTVRRRLQKGMGKTPLGNSCKPLLPPLIERSYINLACAEIEKQSQRKDMIAKLSPCTTTAFLTQVSC